MPLAPPVAPLPLAAETKTRTKDDRKEEAQVETPSCRPGLAKDKEEEEEEEEDEEEEEKVVMGERF